MNYEEAVELVKKGIPVYASSSIPLSGWGNNKLYLIRSIEEFDAVEEAMLPYYVYPSVYTGYLSEQASINLYGQNAVDQAKKFALLFRKH
jgi:hypothetical protein